jgi:hypothetical protein
MKDRRDPLMQELQELIENLFHGRRSGVATAIRVARVQREKKRWVPGRCATKRLR